MKIKSLRLFLLLFVFKGILYSQTEKQIDSLQQVLVDTKDTARINVILEIAYQYQRVNTDSCLKYAQQARTESEKIKFYHGEALSYKMMASAYQQKGEMPVAEKLAMIAFEKLSLYGTLTEKGDVTNLLGLIYMGQAKYYQAEKYYKDALSIYIDTDDSVGVVIALHNIGVVNFYRGDYAVVAQYYRESLKLAEKLDNKRFVNVNLLNLGLLFSSQKDYHKAKQYIKKALINFRASGETSGEANAMVHLASAYFNEGSLDSALVTNQEALRLYRELGGENGISQALSHIGDIMVEYGKFGEAKNYFSEAIQLRRKNEDPYGLAISYTGMANAIYGLGNITESKLYYDSALTISQNIGTIWQTVEVYQSIASFHANQGNYQQAFEAMQKFAQFKDSLFTTEKMEVVKELEAQYETTLAQRELSVQKKENKILKRSNNLFVFLLVALGVIILLVVLLGITQIKRTKLANQKNLEIAEKNRLLAESQQKATAAELERSKIEQEKTLAELQFKKKELTQLALHINQQNDFLESLKNNIKEISVTPEVKSLERELDAKLNLDKQREDFELNIDLINEDFYRKLTEKFPQLNENEKKLCAMIRLNLSSKEIAAIQNISSKSVDMNRYRMRKKLNLTGEEDLSKFLAEL